MGTHRRRSFPSLLSAPAFPPLLRASGGAISSQQSPWLISDDGPSATPATGGIPHSTREAREQPRRPG
jgi:hypothetical protein